ncbi:nuclear transport factor 2 family protein, partial [Pseudomonas aeruginosa]
LKVLLTGLVLSAAGQTALADTQTDVTNALRERLDVVEAKWAKKDAAGIVQETYVPETEITGEQTPALYTGSVQLNELVTSLVKDSKSASIVLNRVTPLGKDAAYTWVTWNVVPTAGEPFKMKSLFVWKLTPKGWRIVADMYASGEIPQ